MKCIKCGYEMDLIDVMDDPEMGYAYNLFKCINCLVICKNNVWKNPGNLWIMANNEIKIEHKE